ncbi:SatD family protein [Halanaerobium saccharolyticum]|uniref:SatD family protein n=1 Tax=Halanaerobium saccharolyticum TaxID=43595 RepID=A0A4R7YQF6_9FIRM|nr:SatD family protein [Halanaerobium saccharolyticum]RAK04159.1 SatD family protein [Halanaerobium saccharolyticum]TDV97954.1 SatD family protein [Halanaerobium saccharolyticum]TDX51015.1 SatD family protein [Halanaerobium saccharolyticum]
MTKYTVITGDVIQSRKYNKISEILKNNLKEINYPDNMVIPFKISRGDEIQAVFKGNLTFPNLIRQIRYKLNNIDIRFGIGFGEINEEISEINSWSMNGPAFHNARESLKEIEVDNKFKTIFKSDYKIDEAINTLLF